jgi:hypothetical protein
VAVRLLLDRLLAKLAIVPACVTLLRAARRRTTTELWIGDSHAMSFNDRVGLGMFMRGPEGQLVFRIGTRLMYSIAQKDFPPRLARLARALRLTGHRGSIVPFFITGEIDVRCHLTEHDGDYGFVTAYVQRCRDAMTALGSRRAVIVVPPPPSAACPDIEQFPIKGSIEARVAAFEGLRSALRRVVSQHDDLALLDTTEDLADSTGALRGDLTDDGCHTNLAGVALVRPRVRALHLDPPSSATVT